MDTSSIHFHGNKESLVATFQPLFKLTLSQKLKLTHFRLVYGCNHISKKLRKVEKMLHHCRQMCLLQPMVLGDGQSLELTQLFFPKDYAKIQTNLLSNLITILRNRSNFCLMLFRITERQAVLHVSSYVQIKLNPKYILVTWEILATCCFESLVLISFKFSKRKSKLTVLIFHIRWVLVATTQQKEMNSYTKCKIKIL